ncbi:hypothetical protein DH2020_030652 [Rehmannia glutinosa]|uniref:Uncharacterized protein n=1 Tax=Rehmannia glutinosa TaxID=99300 RepID=A0ABR0VNR1_REHGL
MNLILNIPSTAIKPKFSTFACFHPKIPKPVTGLQISTPKRIPARDRVIDLGKYKGKMLGSLPSNYLRWVSKNLRAGDMEEWAKLADEVLSDPVYRDRIEWELAEKVLNGNAASPRSNGNGSNAVSELLEISERFGWDNEDKGGWSKIDFGLLGTSKSGRIPRLAAAETNAERLKEEEKIKAEEISDGGRRRERRERAKQRREGMGKKEEMNDEPRHGGSGDSGFMNGNPFPGREALLKKVLNRQRLY